MFVYVIVNSVTGKIYIGQHKDTNLKKYLQTKLSQAHYELKRKGHGSGSHLYASMRKHRRDAFSIHPLISGVQTRAELDEHEKLLIKALNATHPDVGYNICRGGEGFTGPHTEESKQKQRLAILGRKHTPEAIAKMKSIPRTAKQLANLNREGMSNISEETRRNLSLSRQAFRSEKQTAQWGKLLKTSTGFAGRQHSPETKARISATKKAQRIKYEEEVTC